MNNCKNREVYRRLLQNITGRFRQNTNTYMSSVVMTFK